LATQALPESLPLSARISTAVDVRLVGVRKTYGDVVAVDRVDLEIARGEFFTLLGPSGSGKTTTLRLIAGFEDPDQGRVELGGQDVTELPPYDREVNTVFQDYALFPHMTVAKNIEYGLRIRKTAKDQRARMRDEALDMVRLAGYGDRKPAELSGGQRQRVALARAIVNRPRVLLLDEPLAGIGVEESQRMVALIARLAESHAVLLVEHDMDAVFSVASVLTVMVSGRVLERGAPAAIRESPAVQQAYLGTAEMVS